MIQSSDLGLFSSSLTKEVIEKSLNFKLTEFQDLCFNKIKTSSVGDHLHIKADTGSGKTLIALFPYLLAQTQSPINFELEKRNPMIHVSGASLFSNGLNKKTATAKSDIEKNDIFSNSSSTLARWKASRKITPANIQIKSDRIHNSQKINSFEPTVETDSNLNSETLFSRGSKSVELIVVVPTRALCQNHKHKFENYFEKLKINKTVAIKNSESRLKPILSRTACPDVIITTPQSLLILLSHKKNKNLLSHLKMAIVDELHVYDKKTFSIIELCLRYLDANSKKKIPLITLSANKISIKKICSIRSRDTRILSLSEPKSRFAILCNKDSSFWNLQCKYEQSTLFRDVFKSNDRSLIFIDSKKSIDFAVSYIAKRKLRLFLPDFMINESQVEIQHFDYAVYHASLSASYRKKVLELFNSGHVRNILTTSALEVGVDLKGVEKVLQIGLPKSSHSLLQRAGRMRHYPYQERSIELYFFKLEQVITFLKWVHSGFIHPSRIMDYEWIKKRLQFEFSIDEKTLETLVSNDFESDGNLNPDLKAAFNETGSSSSKKSNPSMSELQNRIGFKAEFINSSNASESFNGSSLTQGFKLEEPLKDLNTIENDIRLLQQIVEPTPRDADVFQSAFENIFKHDSTSFVESEFETASQTVTKNPYSQSGSTNTSHHQLSKTPPPRSSQVFEHTEDTVIHVIQIFACGELNLSDFLSIFQHSLMFRTWINQRLVKCFQYVLRPETMGLSERIVPKVRLLKDNLVVSDEAVAVKLRYSAGPILSNDQIKVVNRNRKQIAMITEEYAQGLSKGDGIRILGVTYSVLLKNYDSIIVVKQKSLAKNVVWGSSSSSFFTNFNNFSILKLSKLFEHEDLFSPTSDQINSKVKTKNSVDTKPRHSLSSVSRSEERTRFPVFFLSAPRNYLDMYIDFGGTVTNRVLAYLLNKDYQHSIDRQDSRERPAILLSPQFIKLSFHRSMFHNFYETSDLDLSKESFADLDKSNYEIDLRLASSQFTLSESKIRGEVIYTGYFERQSSDFNISSNLMPSTTESKSHLNSKSYSVSKISSDETIKIAPYSKSLDSTYLCSPSNPDSNTGSNTHSNAHSDLDSHSVSDSGSLEKFNSNSNSNAHQTSASRSFVKFDSNSISDAHQTSDSESFENFDSKYSSTPQLCSNPASDSNQSVLSSSELRGAHDNWVCPSPTASENSLKFKQSGPKRPNSFNDSETQKIGAFALKVFQDVCHRLLKNLEPISNISTLETKNAEENLFIQQGNQEINDLQKIIHQVVQNDLKSRSRLKFLQISKLTGEILTDPRRGFREKYLLRNSSNLLFDTLNSYSPNHFLLEISKKQVHRVTEEEIKERLGKVSQILSSLCLARIKDKDITKTYSEPPSLFAALFAEMEK